MTGTKHSLSGSWELPWGAKGTVVLLAVAVRGESDVPLATEKVLGAIRKRGYVSHVLTCIRLENKGERAVPHEFQLVRARIALRDKTVNEYRDAEESRLLEDLEVALQGKKEVECPVCQGDNADCEFCEGGGTIVLETDDDNGTEEEGD